MDFGFSPEQNALSQAVTRFAERELLPDYQRRDKEKAFPRDVWKKLGELGLIGMGVPAEDGGHGADCVTEGIAAEAVGRGDPNIGVAAFAAAELCAHALRAGSGQAKSGFLAPMLRGEKVPAIAVTEPHCGTDAVAMRAKAVRKGERYFLSGEKSGITLAKAADFFVIFAKTDPAAGAAGVSAFAVPGDSPGLTRQYYEDMGSKTLCRGSIFLDDVEIPEAYRLGREGEGFRTLMKGFDVSRVYLALLCLGAAAKSVEETIEYTKGRTAFQKPLAQFEGVSFTVVEHAAMLEAVRLLCYKALWLRDQGLPHTKEAAMVKWMGPRFSVDAIRDCLLLHGHYGYTQEYRFEQRLRDVMGLEIADGTAQICKIVAARELYGRGFLPY